MVVDADGLNLLAKYRSLKKAVSRDNWVLTPHPAEAARLLVVRSLKSSRIGFLQR